MTGIIDWGPGVQWLFHPSNLMCCLSQSSHTLYYHYPQVLLLCGITFWPSWSRFGVSKPLFGWCPRPSLFCLFHGSGSLVVPFGDCVYIPYGVTPEAMPIFLNWTLILSLFVSLSFFAICLLSCCVSCRHNCSCGPSVYLLSFCEFHDNASLVFVAL